MNLAELKMFFPILALCAGGLLVLLAAAFRDGGIRFAGLLALASIIIAGINLDPWKVPIVLFDGAIHLDPLARYAALLFLGIGFITCLSAFGYLNRMGMERSEFFALTLFACSGMILMASANDLIPLLISLELISLCIYILCGLNRRSGKSTESSLKYFLTGAFSTAILIYGIALLYGLTGTTRLDIIAQKAARESMAINPMFLFSMIFIFIGLGIKVAAFPFHAWMPDVYEGAPTPVTAFMATGVKAAAFIVLVRLFLVDFFMFQESWVPALWWLAVLTMAVGNLCALVQENIKRMLAYSSMAHAGYLIVGLVALEWRGGAGAQAILFYLAAYAVMNLGIFAIISRIEQIGERHLYFEDYRGLGFRHPWTGLAISVFLLSLAGIPPLAGFFGKYYLFSAAVKSGFIGLAVIGVLNSFVSVYYYFRLMVIMYMKEPEDKAGPLAEPAPSWGAAAATLACVVCTFWFGLGPVRLVFIPSAETLLQWLDSGVKALGGY